MVADNYACAYKEVIEILKYTKKEDVNKIPKDKIILWKNIMNKDHDFKVDPSKSIEEQNLSEEAKAIIAVIFKRYWATDYQRERIEAKEKYDREQIEKEKHEKYNPDNLFKDKTHDATKEENVSEPVAMVEHHESIFKRILGKIKNFFRKSS